MVLILGLFCTATTRGQYSSVWPSQSVNKTLVRFYAIISVFDDRYEKTNKQTNKQAGVTVVCFLGEVLTTMTKQLVNIEDSAE